MADEKNEVLKTDDGKAAEKLAKPEKPVTKKVYSIVKGKAVEIPCGIEQVKDGYNTTQDFEKRITALEIAVGIKKIAVNEVEVKETVKK